MSVSAGRAIFSVSATLDGPAAGPLISCVGTASGAGAGAGAGAEAGACALLRRLVDFVL